MASTILGCVLSSSVAGTASADNPGSDALALSLDDALLRGERSSGLVQRAIAERATVEARDVGASVPLPANPLLAIGLGPRRELQEAAPVQRGTAYAFHAEQMLEVAGQRGTRRAEVAAGVAVGDARLELARAETRVRVRSAYVGAQLAGARVLAARSREALAKTLLDSVRTRVRTGAASDVELELARLEQGRARMDRITAELAVELALAELRVLIALPPGAPLQLATPLQNPPPPPPLATLIDLAHARRAEFRVLAASQQALDAAVVRMRREAFPNPTLFLDVQRDLPGQLYVGGGVALPLPTWRRNQGELAVARAEHARLQDEQVLTAREVAGDVEGAYRAALAQAEAVAVAEQHILPAAEAQAALITEGWRAGKLDLFRVIQASREASDARRGLLEALAASWDARIAIDRATGTP